jgi:coatomer subunit gamma
MSVTSSERDGISQQATASAAISAGMDPQRVYAQAMERIPQLAALGKAFKSSKPVELTESETEYVVACVKHVFPQHIVFQVYYNS